MAQTFRIGIQIIPSEPFWVQVGIAIEQQALKLGLDLIPVDIDNLKLPEAAYLGLAEELVAQEIDALIILDLPAPLIKLILDRNIAIISLVEQLSSFDRVGNHPRLVSPLGLYNIAQLMSEYLIEKLHGRGQVLVVGGLTMDMGGLEGVGEDGRNLITGIFDTFAPYSAVQVNHIPSSWSFEWGYPRILAEMQKLKTPPDAIFSLSDTLALAARAAAEQLGLLTSRTLIGGINGDPQALAAIAEGKMAATVGISVVDFASQAVDLALQAAKGQVLPRHFSYQPRLITAENLAEVAVQKLIAIAEFPSRLVGVNRRREQQHLTQLETSLAINRQIGTILDRRELTRTIVNLIRSDYNYDRVQLYLWSEADQALVPTEPSVVVTSQTRLNQDYNGVLTQVLKTGEAIFIPDVRYSQRFNSDLHWPDLRSRVVLPVRLGDKILGVLDLQQDRVTHHTREQLMGLQLLADQLAIAIHNAELYSEALAARKIAEKADKLKTLLLANVSHEFRTPLNIILGYTGGALNVPNPYNKELPAELISDLNRVYHSGEHLLRLINDLLDLSRAEIDELEIYPEVIDVRVMLEEVFHSIADLNSDQHPVTWQFKAPSALPLLQADPVRLRQILLNLLSNARKFTRQGHITLGMEVQPPYMHIWVEDTGSGITADQQEQIFEPFIVGENSEHNTRGIGLGLTITRRLVILHRGIITVESQPNKGSTFHVYLPLPNLSGQLLMMPPVTEHNQQTLVCISNRLELPPEIEQLARYEDIRLHHLHPAEVKERLLKLHPSIIAWDSVSASGNDWLVMDYIRNNPQLARLPLMLYANTLNSGEKNQTGTTNILLKPFSNQTLQTLLDALRPEQNQDGVLIVDDDIQSLDLYQQLIQAALPGIPVHRAENGQIAISLLKELVPDLIILDLVMPEIDGCEVVEWLRLNPATQNVPVLVISGKILSAEQVERLNFSRVLFQTKDILNAAEATGVLQQTLAGTTLLPQRNSMLVKRAIFYLQHNYTSPLSIQKIAQQVGISKNYLEKIFHQELGISPWEYLNRFRIKEAKRLLESTSMSITEVAAEIGFDDPAYFSRIFRAHVGQSPKEYRNNPRVETSN